MAQTCFVIIMIIGFILAPSAWADTSLEIELAKASVTKTKADELENAKKALDGLTGVQRDNQLKKIKELEASLDSAVKSAWLGLKTTSQGVAYAKDLDYRQKTFEEVTEQIKNERDESKLQSLRKRLEFAESDLKKSVFETSEQDEMKRKADERFAGFGFGVALGVFGKLGKRDLVDSATLDPNGIVRVDRDANTTAGLMLESHYFFTPQSKFIPWVSIFDVEAKNWGHGPFVAVQPGTGNLIEAVGAGWMLGFKRSSIVGKDLARDRGDSFNIGVGVMVDPNAQVLGDGITKNQALPVGETAVRLKSTTELGWLFVFSYSF